MLFRHHTLSAIVLFFSLNLASTLTLQQIHRSWFQRLSVIPVEDVLNNRRILNKYLGCLLRRTVCAPEARDFRILLPSILREPCNNCTERQRSSLKKIFEHVHTVHPGEWQEIMSMYDPKSEHQEKIINFISNS
uniref:Putative chemosensory protein n=1 Tax=Triatoma brasiliensis TaxID=65344 RepID=A0A163E252_TRIBS|nr:putative chemosensory protein [Triatoma brasiliensis]